MKTRTKEFEEILDCKHYMCYECSREIQESFIRIVPYKWHFKTGTYLEAYTLHETCTKPEFGVLKLYTALYKSYHEFYSY
jgi:hypothetical protein